MKKVFVSIAFLFLLVSCADPSCIEYQVTVVLKNIPSQRYGCYATLQGPEEKNVVDSYLNDDNSFRDTYHTWHMGNQVDMRNPDESKERGRKLKKIFDTIEAGGTYMIDEKIDGKCVPKYKIECSKDDVKNVTGNHLYRCYEVTLDWNKRVAI